MLLSKDFSIAIINLYNVLLQRNKAVPVVNQLLRSGTSIGANLHEANYASSRADFINKLQISLKECYETDYWLNIFHETHIIEQSEYEDLFAQCSKMRTLLIAAITTAKKNLDQ